MNIQSAFNLPFVEMQKYIAGKKAVLPTQTWRDIEQSAHSKAFVIAGVTKTEFLTDVLGILKEQSESGVSYSDFRKKFREKVAQHGWVKFQNESRQYKAWRTQVIYNTNMRTAYAAGHWEQMTSETSSENFPYLVYRHAYYGNPQNPREEHLAFNGIVLPKNHSFWAAHYPPNGFNCSCGVQQLTHIEAQREMIKSGKGEVSADTFSGEYGFERAEKNIEKYAKSLKNENAKLEKSGWNYNVGMDDTKGIKSLFEHIQKIVSSDKYTQSQKSLAQAAWNDIAENSPKLFENSLALWNGKYYGNKGTKKGNKEVMRVAGIVSEKRMNDINKEFFDKTGEYLLENPIVSISEADFEHSVRDTIGNHIVPNKTFYNKIVLSLEYGNIRFSAKYRGGENAIICDFDNSEIILFSGGFINTFYKKRKGK